MPFITGPGGGGGGGGGSGTVTSVSSADSSIVVTNATTTPSLQLATLDVIAANEPPAANWSNNSKKITAVTAGAASGEAAVYQQTPASILTTTGDMLFASAANTPARLAVGADGKVIGALSGAPVWVFPPGYEFGYDQITSNVTVTSTTESAGDTVISCGAHTFDGAPVVAEFFSPYYVLSTSITFLILSLFEGGTQIGRLILGQNNNTQLFGISEPGLLRFTPTAGSHTYTVTAFTTALAGTIIVGAGPGGTAQAVPAFVRFTKV